MFIATLIAAAPTLAEPDLARAADALAGIGAVAGRPAWIERGVAADLPFGRADRAGARAVLEGLLPAVDVVVQPAAGRRKAILVADMDSTMITVECIDELADYAGLKPAVAAITERAMQGALDFEGALDARVALLAGMPAETLDRCRRERVRLTPGARALVRTMRAHGARCVLVSGGFTRFADAVATEIGFDRALANRLEIVDGRLTGRVERPVVDAAAKRRTLLDEAAMHGAEATLAVGDGANDIPMIEAAGLGIAFRAKPAVAAAAAARIDHGDLTALLYAQGFPRAAWRE